MANTHEPIGTYKQAVAGCAPSWGDPLYHDHPYYDWRTVWNPAVKSWLLQVYVPAIGDGMQWINVRPEDLNESPPNRFYQEDRDDVGVYRIVSLENIGAEDLLVCGRKAVLYAYYERTSIPRFVVAASTNKEIGTWYDAEEEAELIREWWRDNKAGMLSFEARLYAHDMGADDISRWEWREFGYEFLQSHGCTFVTHDSDLMQN